MMPEEGGKGGRGEQKGKDREKDDKKEENRRMRTKTGSTMHTQGT